MKTPRRWIGTVECSKWESIQISGAISTEGVRVKAEFSNGDEKNKGRMYDFSIPFHFGESLTQRYIAKLTNYLETHGDEYPSIGY